MNIQITGVDKVLKNLEKLPGDVRKAASKAVNDALKDAQQNTVNDILPDAFTLRAKGSPWWEPGNRYGFNIKYSKPDTLEGAMGSQAPWLTEQEKGGTRERNMAIPAEDYKPRQDIMRRQIKPRAILKSKRSGAFRVKTRKGFEGIFRRVGDGLKLLFSFKDRARIPAILNFEKRASETAQKRFHVRFAMRFADVLAKWK